ncbi:TIM-barrel domain-containing protein [Bifidobacterium callitrichidarum]|uniref:Family 31 glucosidase n=1 Tax=Bifidobacterium callitrichidarum TaxID=2052941 RepID=A0A2U2N3U6_9BIFI|nr:TIM-barrel domain-containing protein [Bifidobacterium callitrichidarum]PWG63644.1 family 31 glucosidase [Bifidobacterium callitrichidarum]
MTLLTFHTDGHVLTWTGDGEYLRIEPWGKDSIRVRAAQMHDVENPAWALLDMPEHDASHVSVSIDEEHSTAQLCNGGIVIKAEASYDVYGGSGYEEPRCELSFYKKDGTPLFREASRGGSLDLHARRFKPIIGGDHAVTVSFESPANERLYGMGEYQQNVMDLKGCTLELAHRNSQASVPFVVSSAGYGFLWNNPAVGSVVFGKNRTEWKADATRQIDYWVTVGETPSAIMEHYADATGHAPAMPEWGLGFWQCKLRYWNQNQLLEVARGFKKRGIPLDLIVIDFFHWPYMGDFRFEKEFWPDPKAMCDELHDMGVKVMVSVWPQVAISSENYAEMKANNLLVRADRGEDIGMMFEGPSQFYDATNPAARNYVWTKCQKNYADYGVDAFWLDEAEPEYGTYDFENYRYYAGPNQQVANVYPREYNRGFFEGQTNYGREGEIVNLTRCAWAGSQRYGALVWSGDVGSTFSDLKAQITCGIHMGMAGIPWFTTDMGGFHDGDINSESFKELLLRWCQFSCFSPVMRNHGDRSAIQADGTMKEIITNAAGEHRSPSGADNEPWSYGEDVERIMVKFIQIRELLRDYMRELFNEAHETGHPLMRGLFYEFPEDSAAADIADEYMLGSDLLVAPVVEEGARVRDVYLPGDENTTWTDLRDGTVYTGGQTISASTPLDTFPVFARNGHDHGLIGAL